MLRVPYFAGNSDIEQLVKISQALGTPSEKVTIKSSTFQNSPQNWPGVSKLPDFLEIVETPATPFQQLFIAASNDTLDLLGKLLTYYPMARITAAVALAHPYFSTTPAPTNISELPKPISKGRKRSAPMSPRVLF